MSTISQWQQQLEALNINRIELGLERVVAMVELLGIRQKVAQQSIQIISVAGTNGKGSCVALLESMFMQIGVRVGAYISPHLISFTERVRLQGVDIDDDLLCQSLDEVELQRQQASIELTYFELLTLAALIAMLKSNVQIMLLEVGLGGRLDAVNAVDADLAIISSLSFDHGLILGNTLEEIAREKAGIARKGKDIICGSDNHYLHQYLLEQVRAKLHICAHGEDQEVNGGVELSLPNYHLVKSNVTCCLRAFELIMGKDYGEFLKEQANKKNTSIGQLWKEQIHQLDLPCRLAQYEWNGCTWIIDVAHNVQAARYLVDYLKWRKQVPVTMFITLMVDKDLTGIVTILHPIISNWVIVDLTDVDRRCPPEQLRAIILQCNPAAKVTIFTDVFSAIDSNRVQLTSYNVMAGSFFLAGKAYQWLKNKPIPNLQQV